MSSALSQAEQAKAEQAQASPTPALAAEQPAADADAAPKPEQNWPEAGSEDNPNGLEPGLRVEICEIHSRSNMQLNGLVGYVTKYISATQRWQIRMEDNPADLKNLKSHNLNPIPEAEAEEEELEEEDKREEEETSG